MRKKGIVLLLLVPFFIAVLAFVGASNKIKEVEQDITGINFTYRNNEAFLISDSYIKLEASAVYDESLPIGSDNELVWTSSDSSVAEVRIVSNEYYLYFLNIGETVVTCQNQKGTVSRSFNCYVVSDDGAIVINLDRPFSGQSISGDYVVGLYNYDYANFNDYRLMTTTEGFSYDLVNLDDPNLVVECSDNLEVDLENKIINVIDTGAAYITIRDLNNSEALPGTLTFNVIYGTNVYDYNDLLLATNFAKEKLDVVLRVNLESLANYNNTQDNTELFGNLVEGSFNFASEVYRFTTTFDHDFIDKWNSICENVSTTVVAAIHLTTNLYGNGFTINMHNLCYPSLTSDVTIDGVNMTVPILDSTDLFRGPLVYLSLGAPKTSSTLGLSSYTDAIYALYGQDNIGLYVDGDNLTVSDVHLKNCDFGTNFYNLEYTGTVLELNGNNILVKDSIVENGRNCIRSFSSNSYITNCLLQNGMEFLIKTGSNNGVRVDLDKRIFYSVNGTNISTTTKNYLAAGELMTRDFKADSILTNAALYNTPGGAFFGFSESIYTKEEIISNNEIIKDALSNEEELYDFNGNKKYDNYLTVTDTYFSNSGISAIMLDTLSNGSYLESNVTSLFSMLLGSYIPLFPSEMAYTSYPSLLTLTGNNRFYDWKELDTIDFSSLLFQDIAGLILAHGGVGSVEVTDDNFMPLRILLERETDYHLIDEGVTYVNLPIMKMGGGPNLSDVITDNNLLNFSVDPYLYSLELSTPMVPDFNTNNEAKRETMLIAMTRASSNVLGFEPYTFYAMGPEEHLYYNETPNLSDLRKSS